MPIVSSLLLRRSLPIMTFLAQFLPETLIVDGQAESSHKKHSGAGSESCWSLVTLMISIPRYIACPGNPLPMCQVRPRCVENLVIRQGNA